MSIHHVGAGGELRRDLTGRGVVHVGTVVEAERVGECGAVGPTCGDFAPALFFEDEFECVHGSVG